MGIALTPVIGTVGIVTVAEFISAFPAFATTNLTTIQWWLDFNARLLDSGYWGTYYSDAIGFATAHELSLALQALSSAQGAFQGAVGVVTSVSAAGVSTSFSGLDTTSRSDFWYSKTIYGQQYLRLRDITMAPGVMAC